MKLSRNHLKSPVMRITSAYHPQSNGLDERTNQMLKRLCMTLASYVLWLSICMYIPGRSLSKLMDDTSDDWYEYLDSALFAMNTSLQDITKFTPFYMMFGRNLHFPLKAEKEAESSSIEKAMDGIAKADADEYIGNIAC